MYLRDLLLIDDLREGLGGIVHMTRNIRKYPESMELVRSLGYNLTPEFNIDLESHYAYLSRPMYPNSTRVPWRRALEITCEREKAWLFDPVKYDWPLVKDGCNITRAGAIAILDYFMVYHSKVVLADVNQPSFGVSMEIDFAWKCGRPVICVGENTSTFIRAHFPFVNREQLESSLRKNTLDEIILELSAKPEEITYADNPSL